MSFYFVPCMTGILYFLLLLCSSGIMHLQTILVLTITLFLCQMLANLTWNQPYIISAH